MTLDASDFEERIDNTSPSSAGFSLRTGRTTRPMYVRINMTSVPNYDGPTYNEDSEVLPLDLINAPQVVLGGVNTDVGDGRLNRLMPLADPAFPWCYAQNIQSIRGVGAPVLFNSISPLEADPMPSFALCPVYEFIIEFSSVNYAVLTDDDIELNEFDPPWTDVNGQEAEEIDQTYATEWMRFLDYQTVPQNDWVTATAGGNMLFETGNGLNPNGTPWPAMPRLLLPNEIIKFTWRMVPYRYYSSAYSYLRRFRGKINQFDWYDWEAGELLYLSCNPVRYTPPILQPANWILGTTTVEKWCDMEIICLATKRQPASPPNSVPNANFIAANHNCQPWAGDNQFYYVQSAITSAPPFYSFPFELLFTDPDVGRGLPIDLEGGDPDVDEDEDVDDDE